VGRVYKTKAKVDGEKVTKFAHEVRVPKGQDATMGWFLENANRETKVSVLGVERTKEFEKLVQRQGTRRVDADEALRRVVQMDFSKKRRK